jgi:uncharacterized membrane protein
MESWAVARALHVAGVVLWIGGVAMVTAVLLPATRRLPDSAKALAFFEQVERGFGIQSRWTTLLVGASGFYLVHALDLWHRFVDPRYWWMTAMVLVWAIFTLLLFVLEPFVLHRWFQVHAANDARGTLALVQRAHWFLLALSMLTIIGAVAGAHGAALFG